MKSFYRNICIETAVDVQVPRSRMNKQKSPQRWWFPTPDPMVRTVESLALFSLATRQPRW